MSESRPDWLLLERFLAGESSPAEAEQVRRWLDADAEAAASLEALRDGLGRRAPTEPVPSMWGVERAWARLVDEMQDEVGSRYRLPPPLRRIDSAEVTAAEVTADEPVPALPSPTAFDLGHALRPVAPPWLRFAAAVALLAGGGLWIARRTGEAPIRSMNPQGRVVMAQRAERADLRLPDGTRVVLAPESRLVIPVAFGRTSREVDLVGEGYFDVMHDAAKPFLVHAAHGIVRDLGTRFTVRAYPDDSVVQVVVAQGRVMAELAGSPNPLHGPVLGQGDLARLGRNGVLTLTQGVDVDRYQSWIEGRLRFDAVPLREVLPEVARWYDIDIELADTAAGDRRIMLTLRNEPLAQVLSAIASLTNTRYEQVGRAVRFSAPLGVPPAPRAP